MDHETSLDTQVRQRISLDHATFSCNQAALLRSCDACDRVLCRRCGHDETVLVVEPGAGCQRFIDVEHHLDTALASYSEHASCGQVPMGLLGYARAVHPDVHDVLRGDHHVRVRHGDVQRLDVQILGIHWAPDIVAHDDDVLPAGVVGLRHEDAVLVGGADVHHVLDVLGVLLVSLRVPKDDDMLKPLLLQHSVHQRARKVAPEIVRPDVRKEDVGVDGER
mmetsp:Transcript_23180/g.54252  ORF Transcript_23180/g.54252 Transcript_23180/m.54252 type:complete len:221 (-) Transcript_23180:862-1524(-)